MKKIICVVGIIASIFGGLCAESYYEDEGDQIVRFESKEDLDANLVKAIDKVSVLDEDQASLLDVLLYTVDWNYFSPAKSSDGTYSFIIYDSSKITEDFPYTIILIKNQNGKSFRKCIRFCPTCL